MTFDEWWDINWLRIVNSKSTQKELLREAFEVSNSEGDHYRKEAHRLSGLLLKVTDPKGRLFNCYIDPIEVV